MSPGSARIASNPGRVVSPGSARSARSARSPSNPSLLYIGLYRVE